MAVTATDEEGEGDRDDVRLNRSMVKLVVARTVGEGVGDDESCYTHISRKDGHE